MAFINAPSIVKYIVAGSSAFQFGFKWYQETDIRVYYVPPGEQADDDAHILDPGDYTINSVSSKIGGVVTITAAIADDGLVTIARILPATRIIDYATRGAFKADTIDADQNYQTYLLVDMLYYSNYFVRAPIASATDALLVFPPPVANGVIRYDENGVLIADGEYYGDMQNAVATADASAVESGVYANASQLRAWDSEAEAMTADSYSMQPAGQFVIQYTSNDDSTFTPHTTTDYSCLHWNETAKLISQGMTYIGPWDASGGAYPPDGTAQGDFYIISIAGTISGDVYNVGDWLVWDQAAGHYDQISRLVDWYNISNIPANVQNAVSRLGDTMTGPLKGVSGVPAPEDLSRADYVDSGDVVDKLPHKPGLTLPDLTDLAVVMIGGQYKVVSPVGAPAGVVGECLLEVNAYDAASCYQTLRSMTKPQVWIRVKPVGDTWTNWKVMGIDPDLTMQNAARGSVNSDGSPLSGINFNSSYLGLGLYRVTFTTSSMANADYTVSLTPVSLGSNPSVTTKTVNYFEVTTEDLGATIEDQPFSFLVVGELAV